MGGSHVTASTNGHIPSPRRAPGAAARVREEPAGITLLQLSMMLMSFVAVWRIQDLYPILNAVKIQYLAPALGLLAFMADAQSHRRLRGIMHPLFYRVLGILLFVGLSVPTSLWAGKSFNFLVNDYAKTIMVMVLMAASIRSVKDVNRYAAMHVVGAVIYCYFIMTHFRVSLKSGRLGDLIYYDSNDLGLLLVATIPFCVYFLRPGVKPLAWLASLGALGLVMQTMVATGSRGAFIAFIVCGAYLLFNFTAISKPTRMKAVGIMVAFLLVFGGDRYWEMMSSILHPTQDYNWNADSGRRKVWKRGIGYMVTHPLTGVGARAFGQAEGTISSISERQQYGIGLKWSAAHNSFIEVGAELGFFGIGFFLAALYEAWKFLRRVGRRDRAARAGPLGPLAHAIAGSIIAYCVAGFFVSAGYSSFLYTLFAMTLGLMAIAARQGTPGVPVPAAPVRRLAGQGGRRPVMIAVPAPAASRRGIQPTSRRPGPAPVPQPGPQPS